MKKEKKFNLNWWYQHGVLLFLVTLMACVIPLGIWGIISVSAFGFLAVLVGIVNEEAYIQAMIFRQESIGDEKVRKILLNHQFRAHMPDGSLSDWTDRITDVLVNEEPVTINRDYNFNGQRVSNVFISVKGTRNSFSYRMDEIVLVSSDATPGV